MAAPVALFVYNRINHTKEVIEALKKNELASDTDLFIFSDGPKNDDYSESVNEVRVYINSLNGFKSVNIYEQKLNVGLATSIIQGVTKMLSDYEQVIVLEDDLVTSPHFLRFMNEALELYKDDEGVVSIHAYMFPLNMSLPDTFFLKDPGCWGWATWKRGWELFESDGKKLLNEIKRQGRVNDFNFNGSYNYLEMLESQVLGKNSSWAVRWYASAFLKNKLTLYPGNSLVRNIGHDASGTHSGLTKDFFVKLSETSIKVNRVPVNENLPVRVALIDFLRSIKVSLIRRFMIRIKSFIKKRD